MATSWREELAWAAGFFDGEGCFLLTDNHPSICVNQTDPRPLERFQAAVLGIGKIHGPYQYKGMKNPRWDYRVHGAHHVQAVVAMLWHFLGPVKQPQAAHVLKNMYWAKPRYKSLETKRCIRNHDPEWTKWGQCRACMRESDRRRRAEGRVQPRKKNRTKGQVPR